MTNHTHAGPGDPDGPPERARLRDVAAIRTLAGMGDQGRCPFGNPDCGTAGLPCLECLLHGDQKHLVTDGGYPQPDIGDRVTYVDSAGEHHRALVLDDCRDAPYVTVVVGAQGELGEDYNHGSEDASSVFPHTSVWADERAMDTAAFIPGWDA